MTSTPTRSTIGLWKVPANGSITLYRFTYPDGAHNAGAMVLGGDGRPIFVTRNGSGPASLYEPAAGALKTDSNNALTKVGTFTPEQTGTATKFSILGQTWVTGGAVSPDGTKVVLRTGSDAYEWTVKGGDVVAAITKSTPTITPMPQPADDPDFDGESIAYTADGTGFLTISKTSNATPLLRFTPAKPVVAGTGGKKGSAVKGPTKHGAIVSWILSLSLTDLKLLLGGVAVFGLILVLLGVFGIRRSRQKFRLAAAAEARNRPRNDLAAAGVGAAGAAGVYGAPAGPGGPGAPGGGVYGAPVGAAPTPAPGLYGAPPAGGGAVYGAPGGGGVYGAPGGVDASPGGGGANVYGAPREPAYDPYGNGPGPDYPAADPYAAPAGPSRPGGQYGGQQYGGGQYGGGQYDGGQYDGGGYDGGYDGGGYEGGQYGSPVQPPAGPQPGTYGRPPADGRRPQDPDDYDY